MSDEEVFEETNAYTKFQWECPACRYDNLSEYDPAGCDERCDDCDALIRIVSTF